MGKGSKRRPGQGYEENWHRIFGLKEGTRVIEKATGRTGDIQDSMATQYYVTWEDGTESFAFHDEVKRV